MAATLPLASVTTTVPTQTGATITVAAAGNLQTAINSAARGDTIVVDSAGSWQDIVLPAKSGTGWVLIVSSDLASLPVAGARVVTADAAFMPTIEASSTGAALSTADTAHHYRLIGIEIKPASGVVINYEMVSIGDLLESTASNQASYIILDRCYIHGQTVGDFRRGVGLNGTNCAIVGCKISEFHEAGADSQAICGINGAGPFEITNNYLEGAGEVVLFGGGDPAISGLVPSDITILRNKLTKQDVWNTADPDYDGSAWTVKNGLEFKNAQRVLFEGNIVEHNWPQAQNGYTILITPRNQDGGASWCVVQDITIRNNHIRDCASVFNILGTDNLQPSQPTTRIDIDNNLCTGIGASPYGGDGRFMQVLDAPTALTVTRTTALTTGDALVFTSTRGACTGFAWTNQVVGAGTYGVGGDGTYGNQALTFSSYLSSPTFTGNVIYGGSTTGLPAGNYAPVNLAAVVLSPDYTIAPESPYVGVGTAGSDPGYNYVLFMAAFGADTPDDGSGDPGDGGGGDGGGDGGGGGDVPDIPPPNTTSSTATVITALPYTTTETVDSGGVTYDAWFQYTPLVDQVISVFGFGDLTVYKPTLNVYSPNDSTVYNGIFGYPQKPVVFAITAGVTYYFRFVPNSGNPTPAVLHLNIQAFGTGTPEDGDIFINDAAGGFPGAVLNPATGLPRAYQHTFPGGEQMAQLADGTLLVSDITDENLKLYNKDFTLLNTVDRYDGITLSSDRDTTFYLGHGLSSATPGKVETLNASGVIGATTWTLSNAPTFIAPSRDNTILYYAQGLSGAAIQRWDLDADSALSNLAAGVTGYRVKELFVLADGTILALYDEVAGADVYVVAYSPAGATLHTYSTPFDASTGSDTHLALDSSDPARFWAWIKITGGQSRFMLIRVSDGEILDSADSYHFTSGLYDGATSATPAARFGHSESCTFVILFRLTPPTPPLLTRVTTPRRLRRAPHLSREQLWNFHQKLQIDLEAGVGLVSGQGDDPQVMLRWSDDGGHTWSNEHWTSAGRLGNYQARAIWRQLGRSRDRVYEVVVSDPVRWNLIGAFIDVEPGTS